MKRDLIIAASIVVMICAMIGGASSLTARSRVETPASEAFTASATSMWNTQWRLEWKKKNP